MLASFDHTEETLPYTLARPTSIRMPMLGDETDAAALFVLGPDTPNEMINEVLEEVYGESGDYHLWLADDKPGSLPNDRDYATVPPIKQDWQSPFAGKTIEQAFEFLSTLPTDAEVSICRTYIVVLDVELYEKRDGVIVCKIDKEGTITTVPCAAKYPMLHIQSYTWHVWPQFLDDWRRKGEPLLR